jgi:hypothetical protein
VTTDNVADPERGRALVTIRRSVNEYGTMTVEAHDSNQYRQVVAFAADLRAVFADLPAGTTVPVRMERLHTRGNCWRVTSVGPSGRGDPARDATDTARRVAEPSARATR